MVLFHKLGCFKHIIRHLGLAIVVALSSVTAKISTYCILLHMAGLGVLHYHEVDATSMFIEDRMFGWVLSRAKCGYMVFGKIFPVIKQAGVEEKIVSFLS